jgi:hypothetical protein
MTGFRVSDTTWITNDSPSPNQPQPEPGCVSDAIVDIRSVYMRNGAPALNMGYRGARSSA